MIHCWQIIDTLLTHTVKTWLTHCWHTVDTLLNNGWHRVDTQLTHSWHMVNNVDNWLYFRPQSLALSERNLLTHATTSGKAPSRFIWKATHFVSTSSPCSFNDHCLGGVPWDVWLDWVDQGERRVLQKERGLGFGTPPVQVVISPAFHLMMMMMMIRINNWHDNDIDTPPSVLASLTTRSSSLCLRAMPGCQQIPLLSSSQSSLSSSSFSSSSPPGKMWRWWTFS